jgi:hypothetical protein
MDIRIGKNYKIESDDKNLILSKKVKSKKDPKKVTWKTIGYYIDFEHIASDLVDTCIYASNATSMQKMIKYTSELKKELTNTICSVAK